MSDADNQKLSVRIVKADYYLAKPVSELNDPCYSGFRSLPVYHVPVIRIFGPTKEGLKACVHVHGVFPYIFIPNWNKEIGEKNLYHFASCLDKAINTSFAYSSSKTTHVYRITTVIGRPFYGYHRNEKSFLKIEFYNPAIVKRAADLLLNEAVLNTSFQPYEAHVPYILQFFIDNNLYGMSFITLSSYRMRQENSSDGCEPITELTHSSPTGIIKQSYTSLEVDSYVSHIVNEFKNADEMPNNPGLAFIWQEERKRRRLQHEISQITPNVSQIRSATLTTQSEQYYKRKLSEKFRRYKTNEMKQRIIDTESNIENNSVLEEDVNSSCEELNTQSRSILQLLEKLVRADNDCVKKKECSSPESSPSIIFSDDEMEPVPSNTSLVCSQPFLKLPAEDDSILGTNFSDDEVDEDDHYLLSQSLVQIQPESLFSENISEEDDIQIIDQLDGTSGGTSPSRSKKKKKNIAKKQENKTIKSYNLRSCDKLPNAADLEENRKSMTHKFEPKISPRKVYPQLQIDTQKSPRSAARVSSQEHSEISQQAPYPSPESFVTTFVPEKLVSPTTSAQSESRKSESKRPYPQLDVNIKTSPRTSAKSEQEGETNVKKGTRVMKKRKIDFDLSNDHSNLNMTLMTTRWKKQLQSKAKKGAENDKKSSCGQFAEAACSNLKNNIPILSLSKDCKDLPKLFSSVPITYTISNEIESQKFSLKVCLDNCGSADGRELLQDFLTKRPVVKIQKLELRDSNSNQWLSDRQCTQDKNDDPVMHNCDANTSSSSENSQSLQRTKDESSSQVDFLDENKNNKLSKLGFFCDKHVFVPRWEKGKSIFNDNNTLLQQSATFSRNDICIDTVTLNKYSGSSSNSDTKLFVINPKVPNVRLSETVSIKKNYYNIGDFPVNKKEGLDANRCNTDVGDDQFMVPDVQDVGVCSVQLKTRLYDKSKKEFPFESDLFSNPSVFEDEDLAKVKCNYSLSDEDFPHNFPKSDALCHVYSSAGDDEFPESAASQLNLVHGSNLLENTEKLCSKLYSSAMSPVSGRYASNSTFSQNSDEDEAFANIKLDNLTSQNNLIKKFSSPEILVAKNETSNTFISSSLRTCVDVATVMCDNNVDVANDFPVPDLHLFSLKMPSDSLTEITTKLQPQFMFDNSIWDSVTDPASDDDADDQIRSFYSNKSVTSNEVTMLQCDKIQDQKSSALDQVFISQNENEIMSFYDTESLISASDAELDTNSPNEKSLVVRRPSDDFRADSSPLYSGQSVLHSTPQTLRNKKSPSPTYTPIIKKLMLKKIAKEEKGIRSRKSSRRFQSEPFLANIKEEEERREEITEDVPMKLLINTSNEKSNIDKKPLDKSRSSYNNGSGEIDITLANTYGFRMNLENLQDVKAEIQHQFITVMSMEIFTTTRSYYNPDPEYDPVCALFYTVFVDDSDSPKLDSGVIIVTQDFYTLDFVRFKCETVQVKNEEELFDIFIKLIRKWDPDIFVGYEVEMLSWGYLIQRGQVLGRNYDVELSRLKEMKSEIPKDKTVVDNIDYSDDLKLVGRIVLNIWRLMRHEIALQSYSFENIVFHILHQRVPLHSFSILTEWWRNPLRRWIVIDYYLLRVESNILLLQQLDFIGRTSELARLFGIQFYEVLSRGSQFRVESMMLRLAKTRNFVAVSPSIKQRAAMRAPESLPLIMEPESKYRQMVLKQKV